MLKIFIMFVLTLTSSLLLAAPSNSELQFGKMKLQLPEKYFFTPMPSMGAMQGEGEKSTVMVLVKSTGIPKYHLPLAQKIWERNLAAVGIKKGKELCQDKSGTVQCEHSEGASRMVMAFGAKQIITVQYKMKSQRMPAQSEIKIWEQK